MAGDTKARPEPFVHGYRECGGCGLKLHIYFFPWRRGSKTERDFRRCLPCIDNAKNQ